MVAAHDVPDLAPLDAPQTLEERRARQRLHVKRTYYRKLMEMQALRDTVQQLEAEFTRLEIMKRSVENQDDTLHTIPTDLATSTERRRFNETLEIKAQLRKEHDALQRAIAEHNRFALKAASWIRIGRLVDAGNEEATQPPEPVAKLPLTLRTSLSVGMCREIAHATFKGIQQFSDTLQFVSTGVSLFGWRDKRVRTGDRVRFSLMKEFQNISALELSQRGWAVTGATSGLARLYSASMNVSVTSLQRVDDDNEIKLRVMASADGRQRVHTLFLVSRIAIPNGYGLIIRSLDHTQYIETNDRTSRPVEEHWVDYHNWTIFESQGENGEHCRLEFGGEVQGSAVAGSDTWMLEVLLVALRWESIVLEPVFRLCQNDDYS